MFGFNWKTFEKSGESFSGASDGGSPPPERKRRPRIGLALGAGAARGWSHIGVLQELAARKVPIDIIAGASIGAVVGGCFAAASFMRSSFRAVADEAARLLADGCLVFRRGHALRREAAG